MVSAGGKSVRAYAGLLVLVALERLFELGLSRRNVRFALARGGFEVGADDYRRMAWFHTALFPLCLAEVILLRRRYRPALGRAMLALVLAAQGLRYWSVRTLGRRWSVRVIVIPGAPLTTGGPYRFVRHPNYVAVVLELLAIPLVHGAFLTAAAFSALHLAVLARRIRIEEGALSTHGDYLERLGGRPRLVPRWRRRTQR